jgi:hypothetical protein
MKLDGGHRHWPLARGRPRKFRLAVFLAVLWFSWRRARTLARQFESRKEWPQAAICRSIEVGLAGYSAAAVFLSAAYIRHLWIVVFLGLAMQRLAALNEPPGAAAKPEPAGAAQAPARLRP